MANKGRGHTAWDARRIATAERMARDGSTTADIALRFGVGRTCVSSLLQSRGWTTERGRWVRAAVTSKAGDET